MPTKRQSTPGTAAIALQKHVSDLRIRFKDRKRPYSTFSRPSSVSIMHMASVRSFMTCIAARNAIGV